VLASVCAARLSPWPAMARRSAAAAVMKTARMYKTSRFDLSIPRRVRKFSEAKVAQSVNARFDAAQ
jgi:hypothetical protein